MRFLADESCDFSVVRALRSTDHDVIAIAEVSPRGELWGQAFYSRQSCNEGPRRVGTLLLPFCGAYTRSARRSSGKSGVKAFSITFGFATNKIIPDDSLAEATIYILNNVPKTASKLPKAPMLSAD
jgi:hypothetical protein